MNFGCFGNIYGSFFTIIIKYYNLVLETVFFFEKKFVLSGDAFSNTRFLLDPFKLYEFQNDTKPKTC